MTSVFGNVYSGTEIEIAVRDTLSTWFPTYLHELELQNGIPVGSLPIPKGYYIGEDLDVPSGFRLPAVVVISPGLNGKPLQEGDGTFRAAFDIAIGVIVSARKDSETKKMVRLYTAAARTILIQKQALTGNGVSDGTLWTDESYDDDFPFEDSQTVSAGTANFVVWTSDIVKRWAGPAIYKQPPVPPDPAQPGSTWPTVTSADASVEVKE